jgi:hypothetical protein
MRAVRVRTAGAVAIAGRFALGHQLCDSVSVAICMLLKYPIFSDHEIEITKKY